jgi:hypothetical protein
MISDDYKESLRKKHAKAIESDMRWGASGYRYSGKWIESILIANPQILTALDFGAGHCTLSDNIPDVCWTNYDPAIPGIDLPVIGRFDLVVATDVLEHVEPPMINQTIKEIGELSGYMIALDIPNEGTGGVLEDGPYKGHDEHLIIQGAKWWQKRCNENLCDFRLTYFSDKNIVIKGRPRPRARLIYVRI